MFAGVKGTAKNCRKPPDRAPKAIRLHSLKILDHAAPSLVAPNLKELDDVESSSPQSSMYVKNINLRAYLDAPGT